MLYIAGLCAVFRVCERAGAGARVWCCGAAVWVVLCGAAVAGGCPVWGKCDKGVCEGVDSGV